MDNIHYELNNKDERYSNPGPKCILTPIKNANSHLKSLIETPNIYSKLKKVISDSDGGFFLYVHCNSIVEVPIKTCFFVKELSQKVVNVIILDKNSSSSVYINCIGKSSGEHISTNFIILKPNSYLKMCETHRWSPQIKTFSRTFVLMEKNSRYGEFYANTKGYGGVVKKTTYLLKEYAILNSKSDILLKKGFVKICSLANLKEKYSSANISSKSVVYDGNIYTDFVIKAAGENSKGYTKCDGFVVGKGSITSTPRISVKNKTAKVLHEASVGSIPEDIIEYFRMRGLTEKEAINLFIQGFLNL